MRNFYLTSILLCIFFCISTKSFATHIMGGEITWECQVNGQYIFSLKVYRDCGGANLTTRDQGLELHNYPVAGQNNTIIPLNYIGLNNINASCTGGPCTAQEYIFQSNPITLNGNPGVNGWIFTWTSGNRNGAIDNIQNAQNFGITLRAKMFSFNGQNANPCFDSSPDFAERPSVIICSGSQYTYNHNATDKELDNLVYSWSQPLDGNLCNNSPCRIGGLFQENSNPVNVPFHNANGYSYQSPFPGTTMDPRNVSAVLDSTTGEITYTSYTQGEFVSVVKVDAYRCGIKIAEIYREIQTIIRGGCGTNQAPLIAPPFQNSLGQFTQYRDTVRVGERVNFNIDVTDPENSNITVFGSGVQFGTNYTDSTAGCANPPCAILGRSLPANGTGGNFTTNFSWQTDCNHIANQQGSCNSSQNTHSFVIRAVDDFCPTPGMNLATIAITIIADSVLKHPEIICADVQQNGDVTLSWDSINDPTNSFKKWMIYSSENKNGPFILIDSLANKNQRNYTHIGANADLISNHYLVRTKSSCHDAWLEEAPDTISTIFVDINQTPNCINLSWNSLDTPLPTGSNSNYNLYREYPIGSGFQLLQTLSSTSYCDTINACSDSVRYKVKILNNGLVCSGSSSNTNGILFQNAQPIADFNHSTSCGLTLQFTNTSYVSSNTLESYIWDFGDASSIDTNINPNHTFPSPGTYNVKLIVFSNKNCSDTIRKFVTMNLPFADAGMDTTICKGDTINLGGSPTSINTNVTYSWTPISSLNDPTSPNPIAFPIDTTNYIVSVMNSNGCINTDTVTVNVLPLPTIDVGLDKTICIGDTVTLGGFPTSTTSGVVYKWSPSTSINNINISNPKVFPNASTNYSLEVTAPNSCSITEDVLITVNNLPNVDAGNDLTICNGEQINIGGSPTVGNNVDVIWSPSLNLNDSTINNPLAQPSITTFYTVIATDQNNCKSSDQMVVNVNPAVVANAGPDQFLCNHDLPFTLNGSVIQATGGNWINGNGVFSNGRNSLNGTYMPTANEIANGQVELVLTTTGNGICPSAKDTLELNILQFSANLQFSKNNVSCKGFTDASITALASGTGAPFTYNWDVNGVNVNTPSISNLQAGNYNLTVTNASGCDTMRSIVIQEPTLLTSTIAIITNVSCFGGNDAEASVSVSGGTAPYSYLWSNNQTVTNATNLSQGNYFVTVTDDNGCTLIDTVTISEPSLLSSSISSSTNVSCFAGNDGNATVLPSGGTAPYTYLWSNNQTSATANQLTAGQYTVTITDNLGCTVSSNITITQPTPLNTTTAAIVNVTCFGGNDGKASVKVTGGTAPYIYVWSNSQTSDTISNLLEGKYFVTITDKNGCTEIDSVMINQPTQLSLSIGQKFDISCFGESNGSATISTTGGTAPYTYLWSDNQSSSTASNLSLGTYYATVTDANNCNEVISVVITQPSPLNSSISGEDISCFGLTDGKAMASASGGTAPYNYLWNNNFSNSTITSLAKGTYTVTISDANGCSDTLNQTINEPSAISLSVSPGDTICISESVNINATANGGTGNYTFTWNHNLGTGSDHIVNPSTTTNYAVIVIDDNGCGNVMDTTTIHVRNIHESNLELSHMGDICQNDSTTLTAIHDARYGPNVYTWNANLDGLGTHTITPQKTTSYILKATDICNNSVSDTVLVNVFNLPKINLEDTIARGCAPLEATISNQTGSNYLYNWNLGDGNFSTARIPKHTYDTPGIYNVSLEITSNQGCKNTSVANHKVYVLESPDAYFTANPLITNIESPDIDFSSLTPNDATEWLWNFDDGTTSDKLFLTHTYKDTGNYNVSLWEVNHLGCETVTYQLITINPVYELKIPNAFTPDPSGSSGGKYNKNAMNNDIFFPYTEYVKDFEMIIFNRWGEIVYKSEDINYGWDGYYQDNLCQQDLYVYKMKIVYSDGSVVNKVGDLTLLR